jgi:hypothetical protein
MSPRLPDKIIVNDAALRAFRLMMNGCFEAAFVLLAAAGVMGEEIEQHGRHDEPEAKAFLEEQEQDCAAVDAAAQVFLQAICEFNARQMARNEKMRVWIDQKLAQTP